MVAGKTGTTESYGDAWFVGWTKEYTVAVWVGYPDEFKPMEHEFQGEPVAGGTFPAGDLEVVHDGAAEDRPAAQGRGRRRPRDAHPDARARGCRHADRARRAATDGTARTTTPTDRRRHRRDDGPAAKRCRRRRTEPPPTEEPPAAASRTGGRRPRARSRAATPTARRGAAARAGDGTRR